MWWQNWIFSGHYSSLQSQFVFKKIVLSLLKIAVLLSIFKKKQIKKSLKINAINWYINIL